MAGAAGAGGAAPTYKGLVAYLRRVEGLLDAGGVDPEVAASLEAAMEPPPPAAEGELSMDADAEAAATANGADLARQLFVANVLEEVRDRAFRLSCDTYASRCLEKLVGLCDAHQLGYFLGRITCDKLPALASHRCGSHVLQAAVGRLAVLSAGEVAAAYPGGQGDAKAQRKRKRRRRKSKRGELDDMELDLGAIDGLLPAPAFPSSPHRDEDAQGNDDDDDDDDDKDADDGTTNNTGTANAAGPSSATFMLLHLASLVGQQAAALMTDNHASHIVRALVLVLAGVPPSQSKAVRSQSSRAFRQTFKGGPPPETAEAAEAAEGAAAAAGRWKGPAGLARPSAETPPSFGRALRFLANQLVDLPDLIDLACHHKAGPVLQTLLHSTKTSDPDGFAVLCRRLVGDEIATGNLAGSVEPPIYACLKDTVGSHLIEALLQAADPSLFHSIYVGLFRGRMEEHAFHFCTNYVVQRLLENVPSKEEALAIADELTPLIEGILAENHMLVVVKLAEMCAKFEVHQTDFLKALFDAFHIESKDDRRVAFQCLLVMNTADRFKELQSEEGTAPVSDRIVQSGSMLLQMLFRFSAEHNSVLIKGVLELDDQELYKIACDKSGSRVIEAIFLSRTVLVKRKNKLIEKISDSFVGLAQHKFGSHVLDHCWAAADLKHKELIAERLLAEEAEIRASMYGRLALRNCRIDDFKRKRGEWRDNMGGNERKRRVFADILGEEDLATAELDKKQQARKKKKVDKQLAAASAANPHVAALAASMIESDHESSDEEEMQVAAGKGSDEIDSLFAEKAGEVVVKVKDDAESVARFQSKEEARKERKRTKKLRREMAGVLDAIASAKGGSSKAKSKGDAADGGKKEKDKKSKKKGKKLSSESAGAAERAGSGAAEASKEKKKKKKKDKK